MYSSSEADTPGWSAGCFITLSQVSASSKPATPITTYTMCQPNACVSQAFTSVKITAAKYCAELKIADAVPRSLVGNQLTTTLALAGKAGDFACSIVKRSAK